jgi:3'(2'), 5'-bisphosphate nucleotidase
VTAPYPRGVPAEAATAARIATDAGVLLLQLRAGEAGEAGEAAGGDPRAFGARADRAAHDLIVAALAEAFPDDAVLSEEGRDHVDPGSGRVWVVDPLDGTREYGEGRDDWAVHVAFLVDGGAGAAAVALPARGLTLATAPPPGLPDSPVPDPPRIAVSRTRRPPAALVVAERLGATVVELGSAGAKTMAVVLGEADVYAHGGGLNVWDAAAPALVAAAAGLHVSRLDGSPLDLGRVAVGEILVCRPELAARAISPPRG